MLAQRAQQRMGGTQQRPVRVGQLARLRHLAVAVLGDHRQHALGQVAVVVGQVAVDAMDHGAVREVAVVAEVDLAQQEVAHLVETVALHDLGRHDDVAERLGDLLALAGPPAMGVDAARRRDPGGHQEGRPVDRVEAQDVLAHHVNVGRPEGCGKPRRPRPDSRPR